MKIVIGIIGYSDGLLRLLTPVCHPVLIHHRNITPQDINGCIWHELTPWHIYPFSLTVCPIWDPRGGVEPIPAATNARQGTTLDGVPTHHSHTIHSHRGGPECPDETP